jgi:hypothetical protein
MKTQGAHATGVPLPERPTRAGSLPLHGWSAVFLARIDLGAECARRSVDAASRCNVTLAAKRHAQLAPLPILSGRASVRADGSSRHTAHRGDSASHQPDDGMWMRKLNAGARSARLPRKLSANVIVAVVEHDRKAHVPSQPGAEARPPIREPRIRIAGQRLARTARAASPLDVARRTPEKAGPAPLGRDPERLEPPGTTGIRRARA